MKILHLISQTPDFTGSGKFIQQILTHAKLMGHGNFLVAGCQGDFQFDSGLTDPGQVLPVRFDGKDLPFPVAGMSDAMPYESTVFSRMSPQDLALYRAAFRRAVEKALCTFRPDIIHSHHLWILSSIARELILEKGLDIPMVTTCHGTCLRQHALCPGISETISGALSGIDRVMALSRSQQREIMDRFGFGEDQVPVMAGGYDASLFRPGQKARAPVEVLYAGKLCRAKGVPWLLKSLKTMEETPFHLHLAGGGAGAEKEACLELAREISGRVTVHGPLSHKDLAALMGRCHLFVLPSFFEGVPLVLMEALACGCRILATDLPGVREIFRNPDSRMVRLLPLPALETVDSPFASDEPDLEAALARALGEMVRDIALSSEPDLGRVRELTRPFTWEKVFERINGVYQSVFV